MSLPGIAKYKNMKILTLLMLLASVALVLVLADAPPSNSQALTSGTATDIPAASPTPLPIVNLTSGNTTIGSDSSRCSPRVCQGTLDGTFEGPPFSTATLKLTLSAAVSGDSFTGCHSVTGKGTFNGSAYNVTFSGTLCEPDPNVRYSLSGPIQIYANTTVCAGQLENAATGTLVVFGDVHAPISGDPIPVSDDSLASILGLKGKIAICNP